ncbi:MAG: universal stress protein, partial [Nitrososphaeraceae archaeon]
AYSLPLTQIAVASGVIFLLLFTQVNISVITIRKMYGDKLNYGFKTPFFPVIPIIGVFLKLGLAIYLLVTQPISWVISLLWIAVGFFLYRIYTFRREIEHYAPLITSEGDLTRKDFRILIPYTPENPDRLIKYAIRVAKENGGEINVLRIITVPNQTPLSAGVAFTESARRAFEPLEIMIERENILNHYLVRISHDTTEAILATIEEQRIDLMITDFETYRNNKALQTLVTCNVLAILTGGTSDEDLVLEEPHTIEPSLAGQQPGSRESEDNLGGVTSTISKKNMVVLYDSENHSDIVLKTASWLEHSGKFKVSVLSVEKREDGYNNNHEKTSRKNQNYHEAQYGEIREEPESRKDEIEDLLTERDQHRQYLEQIGVEFNEIYLSKKTESNSQQFAKLLLSAINASQADLLVTGANIGKYNLFNNQHFISMLDKLNCPTIIAKSFSIPGVSRIRSLIMRIFHRQI